MDVGGITLMNSMSGIWKTATRSMDVKSKSIQNEISGVQQQMQKVSSKEELSVNEKENERRKHQSEIASLNAELKRHQDEFLRSCKKEIMMMESQEREDAANEKTIQKNPVENNLKATDIDTTGKSSYNDKRTPADISLGISAQQEGSQDIVIFKNNDGTVILKDTLNQNTKQIFETNETETGEKKTNPIDKEKDKDTGTLHKEIYAIVSDNISSQQESSREAAIAKIQSSIAILEGEISQDERHGVNTDKKEAELKKLEKKEEQARMLQSLDSSNSRDIAVKPLEQIRISGIPDNGENNAFIDMSKLSKEEHQTQKQMFPFSLGN